MTVVDAAPPIRLDRYLALLAILLALVLGLLIIGEREKQPPGSPAVVGTLPPPPDPRLTTLLAERSGLLGEHARLAEALAEAEAALGRAEAEADALAHENERLRQRLGDEGVALNELATRLAAAEAERDRLGAEVRALNRTRTALEARIAELEAMPAANAPPQAPKPSTAHSTSLFADPFPEAAAIGQPTAIAAALAELRRDQGPSGPALLAPSPDAAASGAIVDPAPAPLASPPPAPPETVTSSASRAPEASGPPRRLITFGNGNGRTIDGRSAADGVEAYNAGYFAAAEQLWGRLAAGGDRRAQFYFGSILFEGRNAPPDAVMAHVWLSHSVDAGYLPAIEVRRQVRAAMTDEQYEEALAIQADG
jgi:hypothetical protein